MTSRPNGVPNFYLDLEKSSKLYNKKFILMSKLISLIFLLSKQLFGKKNLLFTIFTFLSTFIEGNI